MGFMKQLLLCLCGFLLVLGPASHGLAASSAYDILRTADRARGNLEGVSWEVMLVSVERGRTQTMTFDVRARGFDVRGEALAPPKHKGNKVLMLDRNVWFYKPGLSKPVPISRRQKLLGHAVYGDIASTNYAHDYTPSPLPDESVDGERCYVFDLHAKPERKTTYDRIKYWISKQRLVGVKAEYYTVSGKKFKSATMTYSNRVEIDGEQQPFISRLSIYDKLMSDDVTTLTFSDPRLRKLPDYLFNLNLFVR
jgi:outer membrane lipoprotein-sorting protein